MDSPPPGPSGWHGALHDDPLPPSELDALNAVEVTQVQTEIATELYGFPPIAFTSGVVDLANDVIYKIIDVCDEQVAERWASDDASQPGASERKEAVQKGVNRLETLLMSAVDIRFDQAEVWMLRNTFGVPTELIPYLVLPHHPPDGFATYAREGEDDATMKEVEKEILQVNASREADALLMVVEERLVRKSLALKQVKSVLSELLIAGGTRDTLANASHTIASALPAYTEHMKTLLNTESTSNETYNIKTASPDTSAQPWKQSRVAYLTWVSEQAQKHALETSKESQGDSRLDALTHSLSQQGSAKDTEALLNLTSR